MTPTRILTNRQMEIARLAADGFTTAEIAQQINRSPRTAKAHLDDIRRKLGVENKREIGRALRALEVSA